MRVGPGSARSFGDSKGAVGHATILEIRMGREHKLVVESGLSSRYD